MLIRFRFSVGWKVSRYSSDKKKKKKKKKNVCNSLYALSFSLKDTTESPNAFLIFNYITKNIKSYE